MASSLSALDNGSHPIGHSAPKTWTKAFKPHHGPGYRIHGAQEAVHTTCPECQKHDGFEDVFAATNHLLNEHNARFEGTKYDHSQTIWTIQYSLPLAP